jgi:hypothetical protein
MAARTLKPTKILREYAALLRLEDPAELKSLGQIAESPARISSPLKKPPDEGTGRAAGLQYMPICEEILWAACPHAANGTFLNRLSGIRVSGAIHTVGQERGCGIVENSHRVSAFLVFHDDWPSQAKNW